ncbi:MAG: hypothetical protein RQ756_02055, partial [Flavobacteriaceae bacterium]|nr:hypothetical protein [Flavobacteriaceae bacterium]
MKTKIKLISLFLLFLTIIGCQNFDKKVKQSIEKTTTPIQIEYGKMTTETENLGVELQTNQFNNWTDLVNRAEMIVCIDSLPKITFATDNDIKTIYFQNICLEEDSDKIIKQKRGFEIHNDTILKNRKTTFPMDSLKNVLSRDILNNGKNPMLSENSEKLQFFISYDKNNEFNELSKILNQLAETYYSITNKTDIKIWLIDKGYFNPPPKP